MTDPRFDLGTDQLAMTPTLAAGIASALPQLPRRHRSGRGSAQTVSATGMADLAPWANAMQLPGAAA